MTRWLLLGLVLVLVPVSSADAGWDRVKSYMQAEAEVVHEDEDRLVLRHPDLSVPLVLTHEQMADSHIYGALQRNRQGNPYRVWVATAQFWENPELPRAMWSRFFRAEFLGIVRPPDAATSRSLRVAR